MDSKGVSTSHAGATGKQTAKNDSPEPLLDVFKAAALSVTKLYKTSALVETRARVDGYQECLDDILAFLDRENIGLDDGEGWRIRRWATARLNGGLPNSESDEELDKAETTSSPETTRTNDEPQATAPSRTESTPPTVVPINEEFDHFKVPSQDNFTFQSTHPYPNIATLDLSDTRSLDGNPHSTRTAKTRKSGPRSSSNLGRGAGSKRRIDFSEFFGGCLNGKDNPSGGNKRSRHT